MHKVSGWTVTTNFLTTNKSLITNNVAIVLHALDSANFIQYTCNCNCNWLWEGCSEIKDFGEHPNFTSWEKHTTSAFSYTQCTGKTLRFSQGQGSSCDAHWCIAKEHASSRNIIPHDLCWQHDSIWWSCIAGYIIRVVWSSIRDGHSGRANSDSKLWC